MDTTGNTPAPLNPYAEALAAIEEGRLASYLGLAEQAPPKLLFHWAPLVLAADRAEARRVAAEAELAAIEADMRQVEAAIDEWRVPEGPAPGAPEELCP